MQRISLIAAHGRRTRAIGKENKLLWHLPGDLPRFKRLTTGHPVIMGRHTWLSLPERQQPLPDRTNIVISRATWLYLPGAVRAPSFSDALDIAMKAPGNNEIFVIGGERVYRAALPYAHRLYLTLVDDDAEGDAFFPDYTGFTRVVEEEDHPEHTPSFSYLTLDR